MSGALTVFAGSAVLAGVAGPVAELAGVVNNRDRTVEVARQFAAGRAESAEYSQAYVGEHSNDQESWASIDALSVSLPGSTGWIEAENVRRYGRGITIEDPSLLGWQFPTPLRHYESPAAVHVLPGPNGPRVMADEDIDYWLNTPWPRRWHEIRLYGWILSGYAVLAGAVCVRSSSSSRRSIAVASGR